MISDRLRRVKKAFALNNTQLAEVAGVSRQAVGNWFNLGIAPSAAAVVNLHTRLGVSDEWLVFDRGNMFKAAEALPRNAEAAALFDAMSERDQGAVLVLMRYMQRG